MARKPNPGLYRKFKIERLVGETKPTAEYFVLDVHGDPWAREAVRTYAEAAERDGVLPLATDIYEGLTRLKDGGHFLPDDY